MLLLQSKAPYSGTSLLCLIPSPSLGLWRGVLGDSAATPKHGEGGGTQNGDSLQPGRGGKGLGWEKGCAPVLSSDHCKIMVYIHGRLGKWVCSSAIK